MQNDGRIAKNTIFLYIRMAFAMVVSLYTVRVILQVLGVEDYGIFSAVGGIMSSLTVFTTTLSTASQRFFSIELGKGDINGLNRVFNAIVVLYILVGIFTLVIAETIGVWFLYNKMTIPLERLNAAFIILQTTIVSFIISIVTSPFQAMIIAKEDMKIYAYVGVYDVVVKLLIVFLLQLFKTDKLILYGFLLLLSSVSSQLIYFFFSKYKYCEINLKLAWDTSTMKSVFFFSGWSFIGSLALLFNTQGLNLLMNVFFGPVVNAAYNIANSVRNSSCQLAGNLFVAVRPNIIKEYALGKFSYIKKIFLFSTKVIFCLLFIIMFPILIETKEILSLWLGNVGDHMISFVRLMLVWGIILNIGEPITAIVQAANKVKKYHLMVDSFTLITLPLSYIVFYFGFVPETAFTISIVMFIIALFIRLNILKNIIYISLSEYLVAIILKIIIVLFVSFGLGIGIKIIFCADGLIMLCLYIILEMIVAITSCYFILFDKDERTRINGMIIQLCGKLFCKSVIR